MILSIACCVEWIHRSSLQLQVCAMIVLFILWILCSLYYDGKLWGSEALAGEQNIFFRHPFHRQFLVVILTQFRWIQNHISNCYVIPAIQFRWPVVRSLSFCFPAHPPHNQAMNINGIIAFNNHTHSDGGTEYEWESGQNLRGFQSLLVLVGQHTSPVTAASRKS